MYMKRKILIITLLLILITLLLLYINNGIYKEYSNSYFYMDTYINIKLNSNKSKKEIDRRIDDIIKLSEIKILSNSFKKLECVNLLFSCLSFGHGSEKFK